MSDFGLYLDVGPCCIDVQHIDGIISDRVRDVTYVIEPSNYFHIKISDVSQP